MQDLLTCRTLCTSTCCNASTCLSFSSSRICTKHAHTDKHDSTNFAEYALADAYATNCNNTAHQCLIFAVFLADAQIQTLRLAHADMSLPLGFQCHSQIFLHVLIPIPSLSPSRRHMDTQTTTCSSSITTSAFSEWFSASNVDMASSSSHNRSFSFSRSSCKADSSSLSRSVVLLRFSCSVFSSSCTRSRHWSRCGTCLERWSLRGLGIEIS